MAEIKYKRLTRARARGIFSVGFMSRSSLWLGPDHLLCVDFNGYAENYKRFYFSDIQALTVRETRRRTIWNVILLIPLIFSLVGLFASLFPFSTGGVIGWSIAATIFFIPAVVNNFLGTACACQLRTAVQTEELPSLSRVRKTRAVLAKIRPLITAAQGGELPADIVSAWMRDSVQKANPPAQNAESVGSEKPQS